MQEEILNIAYHIKQMVKKALNKYEPKTAAKRLNISYRALHRYKRNFDIRKNSSGVYFAYEKTKK